VKKEIVGLENAGPGIQMMSSTYTQVYQTTVDHSHRQRQRRQRHLRPKCAKSTIPTGST